MTGEVDLRGTPILRLEIDRREWIAVIDTGFDGELELPNELADYFAAESVGQTETTLGGGRVVEEELFQIEFPFDGNVVIAEACFSPFEEILIGTALILNYKLEINFVLRTVQLDRITSL